MNAVMLSGSVRFVEHKEKYLTFSLSFPSALKKDGKTEYVYIKCFVFNDKVRAMCKIALEDKTRVVVSGRVSGYRKDNQPNTINLIVDDLMISGSITNDLDAPLPEAERDNKEIPF